jgi:queuosine precursor transporter
MDQSIAELLAFFHQYSGDAISGMVLLLSLVLLLFAWKSFGIVGLYVFQSVALIAANIQVLAMGSTFLSPEPIALGTIAFATTYVAEDIINQHGGIKAANRGIWLGFMGQLMFSVVMLSALAYKPAPGDPVHAALSLLFVPSLRFMAASLCAYALSHFLNVRLFAFMRSRFAHYPAWVSAGVSGWSATVVDHFLFSYVAWKVLASDGISWRILWYSYFMPSLVPRIVMALCVAPVVSLSYRWANPLTPRLQLCSTSFVAQVAGPSPPGGEGICVGEG